jgi:8-oxo-dGTP pyrophosphatase MutT (NUDIX family)
VSGGGSSLGAGAALRNYYAGLGVGSTSGDLIDWLAWVGDPWDRSAALHLTASALVVHRESARILLRWHERLVAWAQVGGHGDPGEEDPLAIALREAAEETGLRDLRPCVVPGRLGWGELLHVDVVPVPARPGAESRAAEPAHEHADLRYLLETDLPAEARAESEGAPVRWVSFAEALSLTDSSTRELVERARAVVEQG